MNKKQPKAKSKKLAIRKSALKDLTPHQAEAVVGFGPCRETNQTQ